MCNCCLLNKITKKIYLKTDFLNYLVPIFGTFFMIVLFILVLSVAINNINRSVNAWIVSVGF